MMKKMHSVLFLLFLMASIHQSGISQVIVDDYKKMNMEEKRLIIAPIFKLDFIDSSFWKAYPKMVSPEDSLFRYFNYVLTEKIRKHSKLYRVYSSTYKEEPKLVKRKLFYTDSGYVEMLLPNDSSRVKMVLKDQNRTEPDFILFLQIEGIRSGSISALGAAFSDVLSNVDYLGSYILDRHGTLEEHEAVVFVNVKYVYWDNKIGRVAAFNRRHIYFSQVSTESFNPENPFFLESKVVDLFVRHILSKTPFAASNMAY